MTKCIEEKASLRSLQGLQIGHLSWAQRASKSAWWKSMGRALQKEGMARAKAHCHKQPDRAKAEDKCTASRLHVVGSDQM